MKFQNTATYKGVLQNQVIFPMHNDNKFGHK